MVISETKVLEAPESTKIKTVALLIRNLVPHLSLLAELTHFHCQL